MYVTRNILIKKLIYFLNLNWDQTTDSDFCGSNAFSLSIYYGTLSVTYCYTIIHHIHIYSSLFVID